MGASPVVQVDDLGKAYGPKRLFEGASFEIHDGDRVAVVGPNGAGKTTLMRLLAGRERPNHGTVSIREGVTGHWFDQHPEIPADATLRELLVAPRPTPPALAEELRALDARIADPALYETKGFEAVFERHREVEQQIREATTLRGGGETAPLVEELGFSDDDLDRPVADLSGGQRTRLLLARTLSPARGGDLVVLDEPTNHLDVETIEWLEEQVWHFDGTVILVAHDRLFLDNVADRILEVSLGRVTPYEGNYTDYVALRTQRHDTQRRVHEKARQETAKVQATVQQFRQQKRFDGQMASRLKSLEKYQAALDRTPDAVVERLGFDIRFESTNKSGEEVLSFHGLRKTYGSRPVLDRADLDVRKGDRIGLVGPNGAGKSTLLQILTGRVPKDDGVIRIPPGTKGVYYSQERDDLDPRRTLEAEVLAARPQLDEPSVKSLLGRFRFNPEVDMRRAVSTLSGGERARLALLKAIMKPSNLLLLDEPTNHLDLEARQVVIKALNAYRGTLIVVSHDRFMLDSVTTKTAVLNEGQIALFPGTFTETRHLHRAAKPMSIRRERFVVRKGFKDFTKGVRYAYGTEVELTSEEVETVDVFRRALRFGWMEPA